MVKKEEKKESKKTASKKKTSSKKKTASKKKEAPKAEAKPVKEEPKAAPKEEAKPVKEEPKAAPKEEAKPVKEEPKAAPKEEAKPAPKEAEAPKPKKPKKAKKKAKKAIKAVVARGKRKECVARATIREGKGVVRMNSMKVSALNNHYVREIITEPLRYLGSEAGTIDVSVTTRGGGAMGQAQAARVAIANGLVQYFTDLKLREKFISIDRSLVVEDTRRVETKKFRGPKARARYQKSYR